MKLVPNFPRVNWSQPLEHTKGAKGNSVIYVGPQKTRDGKPIKDDCIHLVLIRKTHNYFDEYGCTKVGFRTVWNTGNRHAVNPELETQETTTFGVREQREQRLVRVEDRLGKMEDRATKVEDFTAVRCRVLTDRVNRLDDLVKEQSKTLAVLLQAAQSAPTTTSPTTPTSEFNGFGGHVA